MKFCDEWIKEDKLNVKGVFSVNVLSLLGHVVGEHEVSPVQSHVESMTGDRVRTQFTKVLTFRYVWLLLQVHPTVSQSGRAATPAPEEG